MNRRIMVEIRRCLPSLALIPVASVPEGGKMKSYRLDTSFFFSLWRRRARASFMSECLNV